MLVVTNIDLQLVRDKGLFYAVERGLLLSFLQSINSIPCKIFYAHRPVHLLPCSFLIKPGGLVSAPDRGLGTNPYLSWHGNVRKRFPLSVELSSIEIIYSVLCPTTRSICFPLVPI